MTMSIPLGTSFDESILKPLYKIQVDPAGHYGSLSRQKNSLATLKMWCNI